MDRTVKQRWLEALRSDDYQQGQEMLRPTDNTHCCLGVLCDLAPQHVGTWITDPDMEWVFTPTRKAGDGSDVVLPDEVAAWAGLSSQEPHAWVPEHLVETLRLYRRGIELGRKVSLTALNDAGAPFAVIADLIEAQPDGWNGAP